MGIHTVEKIGGTSMTRFGVLMNNIFIGTEPLKAKEWKEISPGVFSCKRKMGANYASRFYFVRNGKINRMGRFTKSVGGKGHDGYAQKVVSGVPESMKFAGRMKYHLSLAKRIYGFARGYARAPFKNENALPKVVALSVV